MITLSLNDKMPWGKYKGKLISQISIQYLNYAINTWKNVNFKENVLKFVNANNKPSYNNNDDHYDDGKKYTDYQKQLIRQYKNCTDGPDIREMRQNGLDYDDIWD